MILHRKSSEGVTRWCLDGHRLPAEITLSTLLQLPRVDALRLLTEATTEGACGGQLLAPLEADHEVWASGVTYMRSREARVSEAVTKDVYERVYEAERPELFFKSLGWRVIGDAGEVRIRRDSFWNVPEPELVVVVNRHGEVLGYTAGNDMSSRDIEGANPLYLPQAKVFTGSCALGPAIAIVDVDGLRDLEVAVEIIRDGTQVFRGGTRTAEMRRSFEELIAWLVSESDFPIGVFLMTGTGVVPPESFTVLPGDDLRITVGQLTLMNTVAM